MKKEVALAEAEDSSEKILNNLTAGLQSLNIKPDADEDEEYKTNVQGDEDEDDEEEKNKSGDSDFTERGPNGGRPVELSMAPMNMMAKNVHLPVMLQDGSFFQCQQQPQQMNYQRNGNRRSYDECESFVPAQKFSKPQEPFYAEPNMLMQPQMANFQFGNCPMNNLSSKYQQQPFLDSNDMFSDINLCSVGSTTTTIKSTNTTSGGQVTFKVQTPTALPLEANLFDDLLDEYIPDANAFPGQNMQGNIPHIGNTSPNHQLDFTGQNYTEYRRTSQDTDSGLESEGVGSPWSEAPSPGNMYPSPASVDSGCGRSPLHESQHLPGMSPPKYNGAPSPMSHRATPSPAGTSGYGSPGQPQLEDTSDFFNRDKEEELDLVLQVINQDKDHRRNAPQTAIAQQQQPINCNMIPQTVQQQCQQQQRVQPQQMIAQPSFHPSSVATSTPQKIIIVQPQQQQLQMQSPQLFVLPITGVPAQPQPKRVPRKILPKMSAPQSSGNNVGTSGMSTSANGMGQTGTTMSTKTTAYGNKNLNQTNSG